MRGSSAPLAIMITMTVPSLPLLCGRLVVVDHRSGGG